MQSARTHQRHELFKADALVKRWGIATVMALLSVGVGGKIILATATIVQPHMVASRVDFRSLGWALIPERTNERTNTPRRVAPQPFMTDWETGYCCWLTAPANDHCANKWWWWLSQRTEHNKTNQPTQTNSNAPTHPPWATPGFGRRWVRGTKRRLRNQSPDVPAVLTATASFVIAVGTNVVVAAADAAATIVVVNRSCGATVRS